MSPIPPSTVPPEVDTTPPTVAISTQVPEKPGALVLTATAADSNGITKVEFYRDGTLIATDVDAPYATSFKATQLDNGEAVFSIKAYDSSGNIGQTSTTQSINIHSLYEGVWEYDIAPGEIIGFSGTLVFDDEKTEDGRTFAVGRYGKVQGKSFVAQGLAQLGEIRERNNLEMNMAYGINYQENFVNAKNIVLKLDTSNRLYFAGDGTLDEKFVQTSNRSAFLFFRQVSKAVPKNDIIEED
ncbi:Ig-like domain-containing protein [Deinococcus hopiensis]|uniref:Uncharacterized protein n=1 Tax=Deinococcus hopiensis KR-140 TaxID=695939 RepID=A0A1W1UWR3_9DEIO|nr:Ig-like domain-containing protein [Deinococcus hopiensis]SMB85231.1 hypothetical protein SAMN00790413_03321 [Deinococcus hopiensis KR-140]